MALSPKTLPLGTSDFKRIREQKSYYVDKSLFIQDVVELNTSVFLFPRPRRFGKTSNLSMLRYFYEKTAVSNGDLFEGLAISRNLEIMKYQGQYPVIYLTFKDVKSPTWNGALEKVKDLLKQLYSLHSWVLENPDFPSRDRPFFEEVLLGKLEPTQLGSSLERLMEWLHRLTGKKVVVLVDEYDVLIQSGYLYHYYNESIHFMRSLLTGALKDNNDLEKGVLTGILRVAKESIFSGLNNLIVYSLLSHDFSEYFGFTQVETTKILRDFGLESQQSVVEEWYNGYRFGGKVIYNPWSVLNFVSKASEGPQPHWINTSGNELIRDLVTSSHYNIASEIESLLQGKAIVSEIYEDISFRDLDTAPAFMWSLLVFSGYLKPLRVPSEADESEILYQLEIPNQEIKTFFRKTFKIWIQQRIGSDTLNEMLNYLMKGDIKQFGKYLGDMVVSVLSFHDTVRQEPERVYHAFVLGLLLNLQNGYHVRSNRESGYGRYDVMLIPKNLNQSGFIFEFKKIDESDQETPETSLQSALEQIEKRHYDAELKAQGVLHCFEIAVVVDKKKMWIDWREK